MPCTDDAYSNRKLEAHARQTLFAEWYHDPLSCMNHGAMIAFVDSALSVFGATPLHDVYKCNSFFNIGTHRLRGLIALPAVVRGMMEFRPGDPRESDVAFADAAKQYIRTWGRLKHGRAASPLDCTSTRMTQVAQVAINYFDVIHGGYHIGSGSVCWSTHGTPLPKHTKVHTSKKL